MKIFILYLLLFFTKISFGQNHNPNIKLTGVLKIVDSQYLIIPQLKVLKDTQNIKIHKKLSYDNEANPTVDCIFFLQKVVGQNYINMYMQAFRSLIPDNDYFTFTKYTTKSSLNDTINLNEYFPFEPGKYRIMLVLNYYIKSAKSQVDSEWINFQVP